MSALLAFALAWPSANLPPILAPEPALIERPSAPIDSLPLAELEAAREAGWVDAAAGGAALQANIGFDMRTGLWWLVRQGGSVAMAPIDGTRLIDLPAGRFKAEAANEKLILSGPSGERPGTPLDVREQVGRLYAAGPSRTFGGVVRYAVVREQGESGRPRAITLIRKDAEGDFFFSRYEDAELEKTAWFLGVNGTLYGMRLTGDALLFSDKPVSKTSK